MEPDRSTGDGRDRYADFWAPDPPSWTWRGAAAAVFGPSAPRAPRGRRAAALAAALLVSLIGLPAPASTASPMAPTESLDSLLERADALSEDYNGELRDMEGVIADAEKAEERADKTREEVDAAREQVQQLAVASYQTGGLEPALTLFVEEDPQDIIDRAVLVDHLSNANQDRIDQLQQAIKRDEKAQDNAQEKVDQVQEDLDALEAQREEVQAMIADYPVQEMGGPDNLTPRTRQMKEIIIEEFGENTANGGVGCYRAVGGWVVGEHPKGRACDFMVDKNGQMPSQEQIEHGQAIADWAQDNAERLGIMYIIYRQQIWDIRRGGEGWRDMADRGSITENHFDHVHISMF
ncbi:flagellar biosynthesis chaperone FliJ [Spinactinospora alkalitolerans]|uniref:Flagellar biosynthesis chaperone FliJ n=1 Tax=Spinactinospora alkalitolerans TaxID=687207 RepID=A0A852U467_9ACTN|nr:flagellar biosynthesis chaperone FliJ [Spinactinospora alkalitolerans]